MSRTSLRIAGQTPPRASQTLPKRNAADAWTPRRRADATSTSDAPAADRSTRFFQALVANRLEGGRAAILTPDSRAVLLESAAKLGFRPFDAALIIAVVQDRARRGEDPTTPAPLPFTPKKDKPARHNAYTIIITTLALAAAIASSAIVWLTH